MESNDPGVAVVSTRQRRWWTESSALHCARFVCQKGECYLIHVWKHSPGRGQGRVTDALSSSHVALRAEGGKAQPLWIKERRKLAGEQTLRLSKRG